MTFSTISPLPLAVAAEAEAKKSTVPCPFEAIVRLYNLHCTNLPKIRQINDTRREIMQKRWNEYRQDLVVFEKLFENTRKTPYLHGQNNRGWRADFDWLLQEPNMTRVLEGIYKDMFKSVKSTASQENSKHRTNFHLPTSRFSHYTNQQLEGMLLVRNRRRPSHIEPGREAVHGS